jgi:hypothetical protein
MCYGSGCPLELYSGKCGHAEGPVACRFDNIEEYWDAKERYDEEKADHLYEQQKERRFT